jgi:photosystem II stability/assembly factor-like uncharacterized protein
MVEVIGWFLVDSNPGINSAMQGVYFLNRDTGWFLGSYKIFRTYDGGNTLDSFYAPWFTNSDIYFKNIDTGIFCGDGVVFKTTNGGMNWLNTNVSPGIFYQFRKLAVVNNKVWVIASGDAPVFHSTNFCESWDVLDTINCYPPSVMFSVAFANELTGWTGGNMPDGYIKLLMEVIIGKGKRQQAILVSGDQSIVITTLMSGVQEVVEKFSILQQEVKL